MSDEEPQYEQRAKFTRDLPVQLTQSELQAHGARLARKVKDLELVKERKAKEARKLSLEIKEIELEIKRIADARDKGEELRPVTCAERVHGNVMEVVRLDTGAVIEARPLRYDEMQTSIPGTDDPYAGEDVPTPEAPTDDQLDQAAAAAAGGDPLCGICDEPVGPDDATEMLEDIGMVHSLCAEDRRSEERQASMNAGATADSQTDSQNDEDDEPGIEADDSENAGDGNEAPDSSPPAKPKRARGSGGSGSKRPKRKGKR